MTDDALPLGPGAEFDAIRAMLAGMGDAAHGIGDDAAVMSVPRGEQLLTSVDAMVEHVHFRREWLDPAELGWRATMAALSDLAAMGASPLGILVALEVSADWTSSLGELASGIAEAARAAGTTIRGGNLSRGEQLSITTTVLGSAFASLPRNGAQAGDSIYVTGVLGGPGAALARLVGMRRPDPAHRERFAHPVARLREGRWLARAGATAAIDVSDGLAADLAHLAAASAVRLEVHLDRVPLVEGVTAMQAMASGEEFELVVTGRGLDAAAFTGQFGVPLTAIGTVSPGPAEVVLVENGARVAPPGGHDHLSR
ncbi:MAG: thiamine-monophosphate kinase [Gemmatimonadetes bacterium]|nr:thiamine-monophosphate kinase [Gemmatimonadota bacterium]